MSESTSMDASAVADYLKQHPGFFEDYADVVAQIFVPHPHGGHAIPIAERQMLALRDKVYGLEQQLRELISHGNENERIGDKLHRSTLALIAAGDLETTLAVLAHTLREDFDVPEVAIRLWPARAPETSLPELAPIAAEMRDYVNHLRAPYCGVEAPPQASDWFDPDAVPADRLGLKGSVIGRMTRHGGKATVRSAPGEGTEVHLSTELGAAPTTEEEQ